MLSISRALSTLGINFLHVSFTSRALGALRRRPHRSVYSGGKRKFKIVKYNYELLLRASAGLFESNFREATKIVLSK